MPERFSDRHGYRSVDQEITVREDAPQDLRFAIPLIARNLDMTPTELRDIFCQTLLVRQDPSNWSEYPNIWGEVNSLIENSQWFKVYDIAESIHRFLSRRSTENTEAFQVNLNQYLHENGIGWEMIDGHILYRGSEAFTETTREAATALSEAGRSAAANEVHEAMADISRRPKPDVTGAIQHAIAAMECTARDVTGQPNSTLGRLIPQLGLTPPLDKAIEKLWGYASDRARHVREGQEIPAEEAELVVSVACSVCTFLSRSGVKES